MKQYMEADRYSADVVYAGRIYREDDDANDAKNIVTLPRFTAHAFPVHILYTSRPNVFLYTYQQLVDEASEHSEYSVKLIRNNINGFNISFRGENAYGNKIIAISSKQFNIKNIFELNVK